MKTGKQSNVFDYNTGDWNNTEAVPMDFRTEKPPFAAVNVDLRGETFEQRLVRLGKIAPRNDHTTTEGMPEEMPREMSDFTIRTIPVRRDIRITGAEE